jgi:hypothetical protein
MNSILNVLLTAGVISIIADAIITSVRAAAARKRELKGLLRMLYVEQPRPFFLPLFTSFAEGGFSEVHGSKGVAVHTFIATSSLFAKRVGRGPRWP